MNFFLDTSSEYIILILFEKNKIIDFKYENTFQKHNELLLQLINDFFNINKIDKKDIQNIYCINGPGSFTGIRVGLTFVKAWYLVYPYISIYVADAFSIQNSNILYISANKNEVYDHSYNIHKKNNLNKQLIGYFDLNIIKNNFINSLSKFKKLNNIDELQALYVKGYI